jgi:hypothetical protein
MSDQSIHRLLCGAVLILAASGCGRAVAARAPAVNPATKPQQPAVVEQTVHYVSPDDVCGCGAGESCLAEEHRPSPGR